MATAPAVGDRLTLDPAALDTLIDDLGRRGYVVVGPTVRDGAVVLDEVRSASELPEGWTDEQDAGHYRLRRRADDAVFGQAAGPQSWKQFLFPSRQLVWRATRDETGAVRYEDSRGSEEPRFAFLGVRACDLRAIAIQDRIFAEGPHPDPTYVARRRAAFIVALNCTEPGGTCFCTSMGTGPRADGAYDLALTEVVEEGIHHLVAHVGSERGAEVAARLATRDATDDEVAAAAALVDDAAERMGRTIPDAASLPELLRATLEHPRWDQVAERCLSCANCTMVCPTCFCSSVEDVSDLEGDHAERWRRWDSCFTADHSFLHGGSVRPSTRSRYRQWLTHKLGTWWDQFGTSGCVGCGRCLTWCPVGIDITEEIAALREEPEQ